jgi:hypothetical protein
MDWLPENSAGPEKSFGGRATKTGSFPNNQPLSCATPLNKKNIWIYELVGDGF